MGRYKGKQNVLNGRVLLLNQNFEILGTIGVARAIRMTLRKENPVIVHEIVPDKVLRSAGGKTFSVPSVISLKHFINVSAKRNESGAKREKIYLRDRYKCGYCSIGLGKIHPISREFMTLKSLTLDHIHPKSRGGSNLPDNLVTCCKPCNTRKGDRTLHESGMVLVMPTHEIAKVGINNVLYICNLVERNHEWLPYLEGREEYKEALKNIRRPVSYISTYV